MQAQSGGFKSHESESIAVSRACRSGIVPVLIVQVAASVLLGPGPDKPGPRPAGHIGAAPGPKQPIRLGTGAAATAPGH